MWTIDGGVLPHQANLSRSFREHFRHPCYGGEQTVQTAAKLVWSSRGLPSPFIGFQGFAGGFAKDLIFRGRFARI